MSHPKSSQNPKEPSKRSPKKSISDRVLEKFGDIVVAYDEDKTKFVCLCCHENKSANAIGNWYNFETHLSSKTHKMNYERLTLNQTPSTSTPQQKTSNITNNSKKDEKLEKESNLTPEIKTQLDLTYTKFILNYTLPFSIVKPLHSLVAQASEIYDSTLLQDYQIDRNKVTQTTKILSNILKKSLFEELAASPFSLSIDESSDVHGNTFLAICAKYIEPDNYDRPLTKLISILPITTSSTGETLYKLISEKVICSEAIEQNFIGITTDDAPNMTGKFQGVVNRLRTKYNHITVVKDISHAFNKIFEKALNTIPDSIKNIITQISSHFHYSTQRSALLADIMRKKHKQPLEILHLAKSRWLSMRNALDRILEIWDDLKEYFSIYGTSSEKTIFSEDNEGCLQIFSLLINGINDYNEEFQKDNLFYNEVYDQIKQSFVLTINPILKKQHQNMDFKTLYELPFDQSKDKDVINNKFHAEIKRIIVDSKEFEEEYLNKYDSIRKFLPKMNPTIKETIIMSSIKFHYICLKKMKNKLPFNQEIFDLSQGVFFENPKFEKEKWLKLKDLFPNILRTSKSKDSFVKEIDKLEFTYKKTVERFIHSADWTSPLLIWKSQAILYPTVYSVAKAVFVLPYSSVSVERIFSQLKGTKNTKRNRLTIENVEACLLGSQYSKSDDFIIDKSLLDRFHEEKERLRLEKKTKKEQEKLKEGVEVPKKNNAERLEVQADINPQREHLIEEVNDPNLSSSKLNCNPDEHRKLSDTNQNFIGEAEQEIAQDYEDEYLHDDNYHMIRFQYVSTNGSLKRESQDTSGLGKKEFKFSQ